ncbi:MAG: M28 family peptidase, partial [Planctomycetota bacterium]
MSAAHAQDVSDRPLIAEALSAVSEDVRTFNEHLTILASPWMEGRLPGTRGMERAKQYMEDHFAEYGLHAPFPDEVEQPDGTLAIAPNASFRQPFRLREVAKVTSAEISLKAGRGIDQRSFSHGLEDDFVVKDLGSAGTAEGEAVFIGYSIERGEDGYSSFTDDVDLTGKIAVMLRFEPMGSNGWSRWKNGDSSWSGHARFTSKLRAASDRGAAAIIIVNPPGTEDPRAARLDAPGTSAGILKIPVFHMTVEAGRDLIAASTGSTTLEELKERADAGACIEPLPGTLRVDAQMGKHQTRAENVVAVLPGKGRLADEFIVVGAHLDHLGMGEFGSLAPADAGRKLHPGADDNASGCAGILLIAERMAATYAETEGDLRSIVFIAFSAEESGLHGSAFYANNPIAPLEKHILMMNFDMIGRITNKRLTVFGLETGHGLSEMARPILDESPLVIRPRGNSAGSSDQASFEAKGMPVLFAILSEDQPDRHSPRDIADKINRVDAVHASNLFYELALASARRPEAFGYKPLKERPEESGGGSRRATKRRVRLGVRLARASGFEVAEVMAGTTAADAGLQAGDRLVSWNGQPLNDIRALLDAASPGDMVEIGVVRDGKRVTLPATALKGQGGGSAGPSTASGETLGGKDVPAVSGQSPKESDEEAAPVATPSPRARTGVMFGIRPAYSDEGGGVLAESVTKGSPAEAAGLKAGDRILTWNGEEIEGAGGLGRLLRTGSDGDVIEVIVERSGKEITKKVTLKARDGGS